MVVGASSADIIIFAHSFMTHPEMHENCDSLQHPICLIRSNSKSSNGIFRNHLMFFPLVVALYIFHVHFSFSFFHAAPLTPTQKVKKSSIVQIVARETGV